MHITISNSLNRQHIFSSFKRNDNATTMFKNSSSYTKPKNNLTLFNQLSKSNISFTTNIPNNVLSNFQTSAKTKSYSSINKNIDNAITRNSLLDSSLNQIIELVEDMENIADFAEKSIYTSEDRIKYNDIVTSSLSQIDDFYNNTSYNDENILQGDNGKAIIINETQTEKSLVNADTSKSNLGIDNISLISVEDATNASTVLASAKDILNAKLLEVEDEQKSLESFRNVNNNNLSVFTQNVDSIISRELSINLLDDVKFDLFSDLDLLVEIQGQHLNSNKINSIFSGMKNISSVINIENKKESIQDKNISSFLRDTQKNEENKTQYITENTE